MQSQLEWPSQTWPKEPIPTLKHNSNGKACLTNELQQDVYTDSEEYILDCLGVYLTHNRINLLGSHTETPP